MTGSVGDTAFPSVNTVDSSVDGGCSASLSAIAIGHTIAGIQGDIFVAVAPSIATTGAEGGAESGTASDVNAVSGDAGRQGRSGSAAAAYGRTEMGDGQPPPPPPLSGEGFACAAGGGSGGGGRESGRAVKTPSSATGPDSRVETDMSAPPPLQRPKGEPRSPRGPRSPKGPTPRGPTSPKPAGIARSSTVTTRTREDSTPGTDVE